MSQEEVTTVFLTNEYLMGKFIKNTVHTLNQIRFEWALNQNLNLNLMKPLQ